VRFIGNHLPSRAIDHDVYTSSARCVPLCLGPPAGWLSMAGYSGVRVAEWRAVMALDFAAMWVDVLNVERADRASDASR
jgi:hypothetical protein